MEEAIKEAVKAKDKGDLPFGAVVVCDGKIIARNHSQETSRSDVTAHAELQAVHEASKFLGRINLSDCVIYCSNEPCIMCAAALFQAKIEQVVIGALRDDLPHVLRTRKLRIDDLAHDSGYSVSLTKGILKERVIKLFDGIERK